MIYYSIYVIPVIVGLKENTAPVNFHTNIYLMRPILHLNQQIGFVKT